MAPSPDGNGVILIGGMSLNSSILDTIFELKADGKGWVGSWTILTAKLKIPQYRHIVIPVFMDKRICELSGIVIPTTGKMHNDMSLNILTQVRLEVCMMRDIMLPSAFFFFTDFELFRTSILNISFYTRFV